MTAIRNLESERQRLPAMSEFSDLVDFPGDVPRQRRTPNVEDLDDQHRFPALGLGYQKPPMNQRRFRSQFTKTQLCRFFLQGECWNGESCSFAHGFEDLSRRPDLTKTSICKHWVHNKCPNDPENCQFAHGTWELRVADNFVKTTLCRSFAQGHCDLGDLCHHAHTMMELKQSFSNEDAYQEQASGSMRQGQPEDAMLSVGARVQSLQPDDIFPEPPMPTWDPALVPPRRSTANLRRGKGAGNRDPQASADQQSLANEFEELMSINADARPPPEESMPMPSALSFAPFAPMAPQQGSCEQFGPAAADTRGSEPSRHSNKGASKGDVHKRGGIGSSTTPEAPLQMQLQFLQEILQTRTQQRQVVNRRAQTAHRGAAPETQHQ